MASIERPVLNQRDGPEPATRPGWPRGPRGRHPGCLGLGPTEGRAVRVGLLGRTAANEMVDRLLAALCGLSAGTVQR